MFKPILFFLNTKSKIIEGKNLNKIETVEWINSNKHHICFIKAIDKRVKNHYISTPTSFHHWPEEPETNIHQFIRLQQSIRMP